MKREVLYQIDALYRDDFRITGFSFGEGEKALCIVGAMRGNENQQLYCCSRLVRVSSTSSSCSFSMELVAASMGTVT